MLYTHFIDLYFLTACDFRNSDMLERFLSEFERRKPFAPTSWGRFQREKLDYEREALSRLANIVSDNADSAFLRRSRNVRYEVNFTLRSGEFNHVRMRVEPAAKRTRELVQSIYDFGSAIAETLRVEFAAIQPLYPSDKYYNHNGMAMYRFDELTANGPFGLASRTWIGPRLTNLFSEALLADCGAVVENNSWGGVRVDLVQFPWNTTIRELESARIAADGKLQAKRLTAAYHKGITTKGENWERLVFRR